MDFSKLKATQTCESIMHVCHYPIVFKPRFLLEQHLLFHVCFLSNTIGGLNGVSNLVASMVVVFVVEYTALAILLGVTWHLA